MSKMFQPDEEEKKEEVSANSGFSTKKQTTEDRTDKRTDSDVEEK